MNELHKTAKTVINLQLILQTDKATQNIKICDLSKHQQLVLQIDHNISEIENKQRSRKVHKTSKSAINNASILTDKVTQNIKKTQSTKASRVSTPN